MVGIEVTTKGILNRPQFLKQATADFKDRWYNRYEIRFDAAWWIRKPQMKEN